MSVAEPLRDHHPTFDAGSAAVSVTSTAGTYCLYAPILEDTAKPQRDALLFPSSEAVPAGAAV